MQATIKSSKSSNNENFTRQGSLRRVIPPDNNKDNLFGRQNEQINKIYKVYKQEYVVLTEYKMVQTENLPGVYVIPSRESPLIWFGVIFVRMGPYEDGVFRFTIILDENFPDGEHPKVVFQSDLFHPVIHADSNELNLVNAFPSWNKNEQHLWQILKYIQWIFENIESSTAHSVNKEAAEMCKNSKEAFQNRAQELVKLSKERLYDEPPTEDKHYITFEQYDAEVHDKVRSLMASFIDDRKINKIGHSWVLPGSFQALERPPSPQSESES